MSENVSSKKGWFFIRHENTTSCFLADGIVETGGAIEIENDGIIVAVFAPGEWKNWRVTRQRCPKCHAPLIEIGLGTCAACGEVPETEKNNMSTKKMHTCEEDFQHFLSYSGMGKRRPKQIADLRLAFEAAWEPSRVRQTPDPRPAPCKPHIEEW